MRDASEQFVDCGVILTVKCVVEVMLTKELWTRVSTKVLWFSTFLEIEHFYLFTNKVMTVIQMSEAR